MCYHAIDHYHPNLYPISDEKLSDLALLIHCYQVINNKYLSSDE